MPLVREIISGVALSAILLLVIGGAGYGVFKGARWFAENFIKPVLRVLDAWWVKTSVTLDTVQEEAKRQREVLEKLADTQQQQLEAMKQMACRAKSGEK